MRNSNKTLEIQEFSKYKNSPIFANSNHFFMVYCAKTGEIEE
jgi:hypothetical protein